MGRRLRLGSMGVVVGLVLAAQLVGVPEPAIGQAGEFPVAIPGERPRADLITFGPLNELGEATVTGAPGAVLPGATVQLVNLDTSHQVVVREARSDGSFTTTIFAPPGSNIMVRHGPKESDLWTGVETGLPPGLHLFPSTTIHRPHTHEAQDPSRLPFATTGAVGLVGSGPEMISAAWTLQGTVGPGAVQPGGEVDVVATLRVYSDGLDNSTDPNDQIPRAEIRTRPWIMLFDQAGSPVMSINQPGSTRLTSTGLPILDGRRPAVCVTPSACVDGEVPGDWVTGPWRFAGPHTIEAAVTGHIILPGDMPVGVYRPELQVAVDNVPAHQGNWPATAVLANQGWHEAIGGGFDGQLPPLEVREQAEDPAGRRLVWRLLTDTPSLGLRGTEAREDAAVFQPSSFRATQGAPYVIPPVDPYTGEPVAYRMEPQLPMISWGRGASPISPVIPFQLPSGELCVTVRQPDGHVNDLGCAPAAQSASGDPSTRGGFQLNHGGIEVTEPYGLTTNEERFRVTFDQPGHHVIEMKGWVEDVWGTRYDGGGTYDLWVAHPLDLDPGTLPGTPLAVGDAINPALRVQPHVQADVTVRVEHYPFSDPTRRRVHVREGRANRFGYFAPEARPPIRLDQPGEYRVDVAAQYTDPMTGEMWMGAATWGGIVMTPPADATLVAHGRRGIDNAKLPVDQNGEPIDWFFLCDLDFNVTDSGHTLNPYLNGDVLWSRFDDDLAGVRDECIGDSLGMGASVEDTSPDGHVKATISERFARVQDRIPSSDIAPSMADRFAAGELPLFTSTTSGDAPTLRPEQVDQVAYSYLSSQRPGVRVRETVAEDIEGSGYWRFDEMYDGQPGVGLSGDLPDDVKFQYVGTVYRDLDTGIVEYAGQGSGWVHTDPSDTDMYNADMMRSRVMPPFAGPGNGGWRDCGGPLFTEQGRDVHQFVLPTAVRPGAVLEVGDRYNFAGHIMPTLDSRIEVVVTGPSGQTHVVSGRANSIGRFYDPDEAFPVGEPGRWTAHVKVWHDGAIGNGQLVDCDPDDPFDPDRPCPSGSILGSSHGRYDFYVVPPSSEPLAVTTPAPGPLTFPYGVQPIEVSGPVPEGISGATVEFTTTMPGVVLEQRSAAVADGRWSFWFDPVALNQEFPNVDLTGRHVTGEAGLSDTFSFGVHLTGQRDGETVHHATTLTIQGDLVQPMGEPVAKAVRPPHRPTPPSS